MANLVFPNQPLSPCPFLWLDALAGCAGYARCLSISAGFFRPNHPVMLAIIPCHFVTTTAGSALWAPEVPGLMLRLQGRVSLLHYQQLLDEGLRLYAARTRPEVPAHWIADTRQLHALPPGAPQWMATDWHPRAYAAGLRHLRLVAPGTNPTPVAQQLHASLLVLATDKPVRLSQHDTLEVAIRQARKAAATTSSPGH